MKLTRIHPDYDTYIVQDGDPALRAISKPVSQEMFGGEELRGILDRMILALECEPDGVAIACPQIGENWRIFIVHKKAFTIDDKFATTPKNHFIVINPEIIQTSKKLIKVPEGCLSVRWLFGDTKRYDKATIRYQDAEGKVHTRGGSGLMAQIFQHENDHLDGILFHDHAEGVSELDTKEITEIKKMAQKVRENIGAKI